MSSGRLVAIFLLVAFIIAIIGTLLKELAGLHVMSLCGIAILILYKAMFNESKEEDEYEEIEVEIEVDDDDDDQLNDNAIDDEMKLNK